jgi:N-acylneuraminate cytidylyltransferase
MIGGARVLAVITARGGSKGLARKNLAPFRGRPLIAWTIDAGKASTLIDQVILSSDDAEIIAVAQGLGCAAPFVRAAALATDEATSLDVVLDAVERTPGYDVVVLLQPTSPLRTAADIDAVIRLLEGADTAVSVTEAPSHPFLVYRPDAQGRLAPYAEPAPGASLRRQDLPPAWSLNGAVYAARVEALRAGRAFVQPGRTRAYAMPPERSVDIDTLEDLRTAERL